VNFMTRTLIAASICTLGMVAINPAVAQDVEPNSLTVSTEDKAVDMSGLWIIDKKASDDLKEVLAPASRGKGGGSSMGGMSGGRGGGGRGGGGRGGGGGQRGGMNNDSGGADRERMMKMMQDLEKEISQLEIFQTGHEFNVTDGMDMTRLIFTDGRDNTIWTRQGEANATGSWNGRTLKIQVNGGGKKQGQVRHYTISEDGLKLTVLFKKSMGPRGEPKTIRLVYRKN